MDVIEVLRIPSGWMGSRAQLVTWRTALHIYFWDYLTASLFKNYEHDKSEPWVCLFTFASSVPSMLPGVDVNSTCTVSLLESVRTQI